MQLSRRLQAVADMVTAGSRVADIGCDHGYIPIYLIQQNKCPRAIAMDVRKGPLSRAELHIREQGLESYIDTRLSDGVQALHPGEADCVIIAGMGGGLVQKIMEEGKSLSLGVSEWILQPQSEICEVRHYLQQQGYQIIQENMILEEGKFYPMMRVVSDSRPMEDREEIYYRYGFHLLDERHPVLFHFLAKEKRKNEQILQNLKQAGTSQAACREQQIKQEMQQIDAALRYYDH